MIPYDFMKLKIPYIQLLAMILPPIILDKIKLTAEQICSDKHANKNDEVLPDEDKF